MPPSGTGGGKVVSAPPPSSVDAARAKLAPTIAADNVTLKNRRRRISRPGRDVNRPHPLSDGQLQIRGMSDIVIKRHVGWARVLLRLVCHHAPAVEVALAAKSEGSTKRQPKSAPLRKPDPRESELKLRLIQLPLHYQLGLLAG